MTLRQTDGRTDETPSVPCTEHELKEAIALAIVGVTKL